MELRTHETASAFLDATESFLARRESENSLLYGLALRVRAAVQDDDVGTRFFSLEEQGEVAGAALKTPGHEPVFSDMSTSAALFAADEVARRIEELRGCLGPVEVASVVADRWRERGVCDAQVHAEMRLFELREVTPPPAAPGSMRLARDEEFELLRRFSYNFAIDCRLPEATPGKLPERVYALEQRRLYVWELDGEAVAMAAWSRPLPGGVTIGYVYTPDEHRGRGYASNLVAQLSAGLLDGTLYQPARRCVTLFTDLANPTSNSIYQKLGYQPLRDFRQCMVASDAS